jgi:hypothetical protein
MMNYTKHLRQNLTRLIFLSGAIIFLSCTKESKKEEFIARVNNTYLTREEFASLVDTTKLDPADREQVIKDWIYRELLYQKAKSEKIVNEKEYKSIIETSNKELAAAMLLNDYVSDKEIKLPEDDIINYYEKNKNYFQLNVDSYLINKVTFNSEDAAINFRSLAVESDWSKALNFFNSDSNHVSLINSELISENNFYPVQLMKIAKDLFPGEISIVINEGNGYYSVLQLLDKYQKGAVPQLQIIKPLVKDRLLSEKKKELVNDYLKELYSKNEIEIKK